MMRTNGRHIMGKNIGKIAILLWVVTILGAVFFIVRGGSVDKQIGVRTSITLDHGERELVLDEMRTMLQSTQKIVQGLANDDMLQVSSAGKAAGMGAAVDLDPRFLSKLPLEFKTLGFSMHADMDSIAKAAEQGASAQEISKMLANTLAKCVACHSAWQLRVEN
ncbi:MAG TPA: hypothetical protein DDY24_07245 [Alcaligenaceae bacterium]|nr:hypothetical protein [Alcaligenaceae bacterium]